jgi:hypothetical protein
MVISYWFQSSEVYFNLAAVIDLYIDFPITNNQENLTKIRYLGNIIIES